MRLLFAGTPQVAVPSLEALARRFDVAAVLTRPDAVRGRGRTSTPSPVKQAAQRLGIPVLESKPKDPEFLEALAQLNVEAAAVVAYGRILTQQVLDAVPLGWYNLHFSLLPQWRGAAPVQRAIWNGDETTGLTVFKITAGMDSGPIVASERVRIENRPTSGELLESLSQRGPDIFVHAFETLEAGTATLVPQPDLQHGEHDYAKKITVDDALVDVTLPAQTLDRRIRACNPDPGAWCHFVNGMGNEGSTGNEGGTDAANLEGVVMHLNAVTPVDEEDAALASAMQVQGLVREEFTPGMLIVSKKHVWLVCGAGFLELNNVTVQGKKPMRAADWARGARLSEDAHLA